MKTYTVELNERQMRMISESLEFTSRFICGQVGTVYWPSDAMHHEKMNTGQDFEDYMARRDLMDHLMDAVKMIGWKMKPNSYQGIGYNKNADTMYDMYKVINHALWNNQSDEEKQLTRNSRSSDKPLKYGSEPLIVVK